MENTLSTLRDWLINDQHEYGEFGKHEIVNPTDLPRTFEMSQIKPNIFSSIIAYSTLCATGEICYGLPVHCIFQQQQGAYQRYAPCCELSGNHDMCVIVEINVAIVSIKA